MSNLRYNLGLRVWDRFGQRFLAPSEMFFDAAGNIASDQPERYDVDLDTSLRAGPATVYANDIVDAQVHGQLVTDPVFWFDGAWRFGALDRLAAEYPLIRVVGNLHQHPWPKTGGALERDDETEGKSA